LITSISNSELTAQIKHLGAELCSLKNNSYIEFIWEGNPEFWGKHSPILFPIVGTLKNNTFSYNHKEYKLSRHGFARDMEFELIEKQNNKATFSLKSSEETLKLYPFEFELQIIYTLERKNLKIEYKVENKNKVTMPFSIGAHPAFSLTGDFESYSIEFEKEESLDYFLLENDLISNTTQKLKTKEKQIGLNYEMFAHDALIFKTIQTKTLLILKKSNPILKVHFKDFPNLGIWTKNNAPFICIEPWFGYSDTNENSGNLFEKEGIQIIDSNEFFSASYSIEIL
jgi:galactose mutarotase-like enzyme